VIVSLAPFEGRLRVEPTAMTVVVVNGTSDFIADFGLAAIPCDPNGSPS
jgi:hypothetical protein